MTTAADEQTLEEMAENLGIIPEDLEEALSEAVKEVLEEEEDELVEIDLDTGKVTPVEPRPPSLFYRIIGSIGAAFTAFASQGEPSASVEIAIAKCEIKLTLLNWGFAAALLVAAAAGELLYPFLGLFLLTLYGVYFAVINVSGTHRSIDSLRQMAMYQGAAKAGGVPGMPPGMMGPPPGGPVEPPKADGDGYVPGGGLYL